MPGKKQERLAARYLSAISLLLNHDKAWLRVGRPAVHCCDAVQASAHW